MKQLTGFAGVIGASALIGFPAWAHINSNTKVANATQTQQVAGNVKTAASPAPTGASPAPTAAGKDIVAIASGDGQFKILTKALGSAGLVTTLQGKGPFTVLLRLTRHLLLCQKELWRICSNRKTKPHLLKF